MAFPTPFITQLRSALRLSQLNQTASLSRNNGIVRLRICAADICFPSRRVLLVVTNVRALTILHAASEAHQTPRRAQSHPLFGHPRTNDRPGDLWLGHQELVSTLQVLCAADP